MDSLETLSQDSVFKHFVALTQIPRESGNEKAVSDYCVAFAKGLGLEVIQEPSFNIIIKKPGTKGYESHGTVILQGHLDMVCVKEDDLAFDFATQPIPLVLEGDVLKTAGTTLGADNGIAVAMIMAILESDTLAHPPIEALFTTEEETGMGGVMSLDPTHLSGKKLINLDAEEEGAILASCAGGVNNVLVWPIDWQPSTLNSAFEVKIQGLKGGHSGAEIDKNRANALKLAGRFLDALRLTMPFELASLEGGEKMNAIAKLAKMTLVMASADEAQFMQTLEGLEMRFRGEHLGSEDGIRITAVPCQKPSQCFSTTARDAVIEGLCLVPFGVQTMSSTMVGLVESSSNLGVLSMEPETIRLTNSVRSSVASLKHEISRRTALIAKHVGATWSQISDYPAWAYRPESELRTVMAERFEALNGKPLKIDAIHAGLECGFLSEKLGDIDMVALGPDMQDVHTPKEQVCISSVQRVYAFLCDVLSQL